MIREALISSGVASLQFAVFAKFGLPFTLKGNLNSAVGVAARLQARKLRDRGPVTGSGTRCSMSLSALTGSGLNHHPPFQDSNRG